MITSKRDHVPVNRIFRQCSSVLSSSLTEASPSGHCERVMTASHASSRCFQHPTTFDPSTEPPSRSREILLRPLSPSAVFESRGRQDHAPRSRLPATTEAPALVPELLLLVHVVGRFYPSDRSGVFRSPDLSQFPARARPMTRVRAHARMTVFAPDGRLPKDKQRIQSNSQHSRSQGTARGFPPTKTEDWGNHG
jgi:hypothetical protein